MSKVTIWASWLQGRAHAPEVVSRVFSLWEDLNPDYALRVIEGPEADAMIARYPVARQKMSPQVRANLVRLICLKEHGGVWVDATLLPTRPLSDWLDAAMAPAGVFAFHSTGHPDLVFQNWFMAAQPGNLLISRLCDAYVDYFSTPRRFPNWKRALWHMRPGDFLRYQRAVRARDLQWFVDPLRGRDCAFYPYAVMNYQLAHLLQTEPEVRAVWEKVPLHWHMLPQFISLLERDRETPLDALVSAAAEAFPVCPVHKLNSRSPKFLPIVAAARRFVGLGEDRPQPDPIH